ncbi:hypothetical protein ABIC63_003408 [Pseudacidovorax sp. 1753]|uniref:hypothetical protein n=1 Tax=Pseudacidovorax sp. 1753 TaxID=3156419 RepID=UPI003393616A
MKKLSVFVLSLLAAVGCKAADLKEVSRIAKRFSETVACQLEDVAGQKDQYKAVKVKPGLSPGDNLGEIYVVYWQGDFGCSGGNGTITPNFTVIEQAGFSSTAPTVQLDYKFPQFDVAVVTGISGGNGQLVIKGLAYGPNDRQHVPSKPVSYTLKLVDRAFIKQ